MSSDDETFIEEEIMGTEIQFGDELPHEVLTTLNLIGKKWSLPILYTLHEKELGTGFSGLKNLVGSNISSNMLSRALDELKEFKLINKRIISESPIRVIYTSTVFGKDFCDLCQAIGGFGKKYLDENPNEK